MCCVVDFCFDYARFLALFVQWAIILDKDGKRVSKTVAEHVFQKAQERGEGVPWKKVKKSLAEAGEYDNIDGHFVIVFAGNHHCLAVQQLCVEEKHKNNPNFHGVQVLVFFDLEDDTILKVCFIIAQKFAVTDSRVH